MSNAISHGATARITGAGMGIGRAAAIHCLQEGMRVVAVDVLEEKLESLSAEMGKIAPADQFAEALSGNADDLA